MSLRKLTVTALAVATLGICGCGDSENFVFTQTLPPSPVQPIEPPAPVAVNDSFNTLGNATLNQTAVNGVLNNDTLNGGDIVAFDQTGTLGGTVVLDADGSFTYTAPFGVTGQDSFTYTLENEIGPSTATVSIDITGLAFFVNNQAAVAETVVRLHPSIT